MISLTQILKNRELVLGRNERQLNYIRHNNLRRAIKIADNKIISKKILRTNNIPVPQQIAVIKNRKELSSFDFEKLPLSFVIKPVKGVRGSGVEIFYNRNKEGKWIRSDKTKASINDLISLSQDIIDGKYSLFNEPDQILIEERIKPHKNFKYYAYKGTPDVRILVFNKIPIMSYVRFPTKESNGKANLDLGAIGAGIDMAVGKTTSAIIGKGKLIENAPDNGLPLSGIKIPYWDKILRYAVEASKVTKLGFAAVDFLIDKDKGPVIVELNARPGLSIQIANQDGLRWRLRKAKGLKVKTIEQGIRLGKDLFGGEIEEEIEEISGKQVIGLIQNVTFFSKDGKYKETIKCKVDTGADLSSIDRNLAIKLGFEEVIKDYEELYENIPKPLPSEEESKKIINDIFDKLKDKFDYLSGIKYIKSSHGESLRAYIRINIKIEELDLETNFTIYPRNNLSFKVLLGNNTLNKFLIDPTKKL